VAEIEPVELFHARDHEFVKHGPKREKREKCVECNKAFSNILHHGAPPSLNLSAAGGSNPWVFDGIKKVWQKRLTEMLEHADLPRPLRSVVAEGLICFPDRRGRDQGNFRFLLEKALGDALQEGYPGISAGGWLLDDEFYPEVHYEFGGLSATYIKGASWTRVMIFPTTDEALAETI
jgi:hypothetical protein